MRPIATLSVLGLLASALSSSACGGPVDLKQDTRVEDVSSGWFDAGIQDGKNKLVPSVTFRISRSPGVDLSSISLNVAFRFTGEQEHSDDVFVQRVDFDGDATAPITVRSQFGYTAEPPQTRADMLKHGSFRDMEAVVFAKQSSSQWVELLTVKIPRQLLTR